MLEADARATSERVSRDQSRRTARSAGGLLAVVQAAFWPWCRRLACSSVKQDAACTTTGPFSGIGGQVGLHGGKREGIAHLLLVVALHDVAARNQHNLAEEIERHARHLEAGAHQNAHG